MPEEYTHSVELEESDRGGPLYRLGMMGLGCLLHRAWAMGNGRRALDELSSFVAARPSRADGDRFPLRVAQVHAQFNAACAWVREVWSDIEQTLERDEPLSTRQQSLYRLALNHVTFVSANVPSSCTAPPAAPYAPAEFSSVSATLTPRPSIACFRTPGW